MEIYKETNTEASKEFEKLLKNEISKTKDLVERQDYRRYCNQGR